MKIDSVITMEVKTREEELEELLRKGGVLQKAIDRAVIRIMNEVEPDLEKKCWEELDTAISEYTKYAIEYDRITRKI